jgi:protein-S-isoprenylcysteine O-methyltransferase Ste14
MYLKGFKEFRLKVPALFGKKIAILPIYILLVLCIGIAVQILAYSAPKLFIETKLPTVATGLIPLVVYLVVEIIGLVLVYQMWARRDRTKAKYGPTAYQRMLPFGLAGVIFILSLGLGLYIPFFKNLSSWQNNPLQILVIPIDSYLGLSTCITESIRIAVSLILLVVGSAMSFRAVTTFGFDYMTVVYLYFPEESKVQQNDIYSAIRHPMYGGMLVIGLGGAVLTFSPYSFIFFLLFLLGFYLHITLVEERELMLRFGKSYMEYRRSVPAFFIKMSKINILIGFLFGRMKKK